MEWDLGRNLNEIRWENVKKFHFWKNLRIEFDGARNKLGSNFEGISKTIERQWEWFRKELKRSLFPSTSSYPAPYEIIPTSFHCFTDSFKISSQLLLSSYPVDSLLIASTNSSQSVPSQLSYVPSKLLPITSTSCSQFFPSLSRIASNSLLSYFSIHYQILLSKFLLRSVDNKLKNNWEGIGSNIEGTGNKLERNLCREWKEIGKELGRNL